MNIEHFTKYLEFQDKGLKKQATKEIRLFIDSFSNENEKYEWVWGWLPKLEANRHSRIRHELFQEVIFPVLRKGYLESDFRSTLWLAKLIQNIYQNTKVHEELDWITNTSLLEKSHKLAPENDEARLLYLESIVSWLGYCIHEWPSGILSGNDGANLEQCQFMRKETEVVSSLDKEMIHQDFINDFLDKLCEYEARLNK